MKFTFIFRRELRRRAENMRIAENFVTKMQDLKIYY